MNNFWRGVEGVWGWEAVSAVWRRYMGADFARVQGTLLTQTGRQSNYFPSGQVCECNLRIVQHAADDIVGVSDCETSGCYDQKLTPEDIAVFELSWKKLARAIAAGLQCEAREAEIGVARTRQVAAFSGASLPVVLTVQSSQRGFAKAVQQIAFQLGEPFVLLAPTNLFLDVNSKSALNKAKAGFFALDSLLTVTANGRLQATRNVAELFSSFLPKEAQPASDNEALRLFALVKALEMETPYEKAPITRVFQLYCMEGNSRNEVAKKCNCAPSLITLRLQMLEKKLGRPPAELRQLSGHFEKIADSLTDSRAKRIFRNADDLEDEEENQ